MKIQQEQAEQLQLEQEQMKVVEEPIQSVQAVTAAQTPMSFADSEMVGFKTDSRISPAKPVLESHFFITYSRLYKFD